MPRARGGPSESQTDMSIDIQVPTKKRPTHLVSPSANGTQRATHGWQSLGAVTDFSREDCGVLLTCGGAALRISIERTGIIHVRLAPTGDFDREHSWAVVPDDSSAPAWRVEETAQHIDVVTDAVTVHIQRDPCRVSFITPDGRVCAADDSSKGMVWDGEAIACWKQIGEQEHFFGLGEKGLPLDKRGASVVNWNSDVFEHEPWTDPLYQAHPMFISLERGHSYGLFFDNSWRTWFDLGKTSRESYAFGADGGEMNYYFIPGPTPTDVLQRFARLVGTSPLPPLWALGYQQCRWSYESATRVRKIAKEFRRRRIPCDVIYLDIDYMDGYRCFTWNGKTFPKPAELMKELRKQGFRVVTILDPGIKQDPNYKVYQTGLSDDHYCRMPDGKVYIGKVWPGESAFPDFTREATRQWWGEQYRVLLDDGIAGFWNDMNEPADFTSPDKNTPLAMQHDMDGQPADHRAAHNIYGLQMARSTFEGVLEQRPDERPFVLTRAGFTGVHRYAAVWTGDNLSSWDHLRMSVPMLLNMGVSGMVFTGADVGGFREYPSAELYTRWMQLGVFYPLCRTHTCGGPEQDPFAFGKKHEALNRRAIELRYRLLPYLYTEMEHASRDGLPVMRPLFVDYPEHPDVHKSAYEFMFGRHMFVAPVMEENASFRKVRLPVGQWWMWNPETDQITEQLGELEREQVTSVYTGRDVAVEKKIPVKLDAIPIFVKPGAVVPMRDVCQHTGARSTDSLLLSIFPGVGGGEFYDDDGQSHAYREGQFTREEYVVSAEGESRRFELIRRSGEASIAPKQHSLKFLGIKRAPSVVKRDEKAVAAVASVAKLPKRGDGWFFDRRSGTVHVRISNLKPGEGIELRFAAERAPLKRAAAKRRRPTGRK